MEKHHDRRHEEDMDDDEIFAQLEAELDDDDTTAAQRERGMQDMMQYMERRKQLVDSGHGRFDEVKEEFNVLDITIKEPLCVVHFFHTNFKRCKIMDQHLTRLSQKYFNTRFIRVFVENVPFLVERLSIKVLPCVICFKKSVTSGRIVGFEDLGGKDDFATSVLEAKLLELGVIKQVEDSFPQVTYGSQSVVRQNIRGQTSATGDDDFEFDM